MPKNILNILKYVLFFALGVLMLYLLSKDINWEEMKQSFKGIKYEYLAICFVINILSHYIRALRWNMLISSMGYHPDGLRSFVAVMVGYFANLAVPRMGEVSRCAVLNQTNKIPVDKLIGSVVTERIIDVLVLLLLLAINFFLEVGRLGDFLQTNLGDKFNGTSANSGGNTMLIIGLIGLVIVLGIGAVFIYQKIKNTPLGEKIISIVLGFWDGIISIKKLKNPLLFVFYTFLLWFAYYLTAYICFFALTETTGLSPLAGLTVLVLGSFGFVAPVQGGIGAYHWCVSRALMLYGLNESAGMSFAFVAHGFQTLAIIIVGAISFFSISFLIKKDKVIIP
jgi:uncharacterized protein (TIRG00374 family)